MKRSTIRMPLICLFLAFFVCAGCDAELHDSQNEHPTPQQDPTQNGALPPQSDPVQEEPVIQPDAPHESELDEPNEIEPQPEDPMIEPPEDTPDVPPANVDEPPVEPSFPAHTDEPAIEPPDFPDRPTRPLPDTAPTTDAAAVPLEAEGLPNLFQVSQELYRSAQPVESGLTSAKNLGIQTVLSLQLVSLDPTLEATEQTGLMLEHVPMVPWNVTETELIQALEIIRDAPKPILVHCLHGADRTGLVIAMYRILFQNWPVQDAKDEMTSDTFGYHEAFANLPELLDQIDIEDMRSKLF